MADLITVVFGGPSPEHEISILTGLQCERLLQRADQRVQSVYWDKSGSWFLVPNGTEARDYLTGAPSSATELSVRLGAQPGWYAKRGLRTSAVEAGTVLSCLHGGIAEGGGAQALFAMLGIPATGGDLFSSALCMDKLAFGAILEVAGVPTLHREALRPSQQPSFDAPYIVKPRFGGSSIGIEIVSDWESAQALHRTSAHLRAGAVVEPYRDDLYDVNISFKTYPDFATSLIERPLKPSDGGIYTYDQKYLHPSGINEAPRELPAHLPGAMEELIRDCAKAVAELTGTTGIARVDFLTDGENELFVNEVNSIPGAMSLFLWKDYGAVQVLLDAVAEAQQAALHPGFAGHSGTSALQAAGGIAGKLIGID